MGGLVARIAIDAGAPVRKLIMVGCPNNGTSSVWDGSTGYPRDLVNQLVSTGIVGYALPRTDSFPFTTRGPYQKGDACSIQSIPLQGKLLPPLPNDLNVKVYNIFTNDLGTDTPWDMTASPDRKGWFNFAWRQKRVAQACDATTPWPFYRTGDGVVSVQDATLGPQYDTRIQTHEKSVLPPHALQIGNDLVRKAIARSLGVID
jgi:hypothetical protein